VVYLVTKRGISGESPLQVGLFRAFSLDDRDAWTLNASLTTSSKLQGNFDSSAPFRSNDGLTSASTECSKWRVMFCMAQVRTFGPEDRMHFTLIRVQFWTALSPNLLSDLSPG